MSRDTSHDPTISNAEVSNSSSTESCDEDPPTLLSREPQPSATTSSSQLRAAGVREKRGGAGKTVSERRGRTAQWDRNGRRKTRNEGGGKEGGMRQKGGAVVVLKESGGDGGEGEIEKVSSIQQDHQTKTQLSLETQKRQEARQNNTQLKVRK